MYEPFFNLKEEPFGMTPNPRFLFLSRKHEEALASLSYGIEKRKGFVLLTGEIGTGKTTICRALLNSLNDVDSALILNPSLTDDELLTAIVGDFGLISGRSVKEKIDALNRFLLERRKAGRNAVVIIDESQHLSNSAFEMVRLLSNLETEREKLLQIVFMGQPELREKLERHDLRQLNQRIAVRYHLEPLDMRETMDYIYHRLRKGGSSESYIRFAEDSASAIFHYTRGYPRLINILCDRVLMAAYVENKRAVNKRIVLKAINDMDGLKSPKEKNRLWLMFQRILRSSVFSVSYFCHY